MAEKELIAVEMGKLDRLPAILASFSELEQLMDLPRMRVLTVVCRREGEGPRELAGRPG